MVRETKYQEKSDIFEFKRKKNPAGDIHKQEGQKRCGAKFPGPDMPDQSGVDAPAVVPLAAPTKSFPGLFLRAGFRIRDEPVYVPG